MQKGLTRRAQENSARDDMLCVEREGYELVIVDVAETFVALNGVILCIGGVGFHLQNPTVQSESSG